MTMRLGHRSPRTTRLTLASATLVLATLTLAVLAGCSAAPASSAGESPATISTGEDGAKQVTLTAAAAQRLGIATAKVSTADVAGRAQRVIPYSALLYDAAGGTWVYANPSPLAFTRTAVVVDRIVADLVVLTDGPAVGSLVVTVGVVELYGVEVGVGK